MSKHKQAIENRKKSSVKARSDFCLVVAHDAGGAEILASYVKRNQLNCGFVLEGPAVKVFQRKFSQLDPLDLENGLEQADWVLCGTGWQSDFEWQAIKHAKKRGIPVVAFLDHWVNYVERFTRNSEEQLPDEIWVGDRYAETIAKNSFFGLPVKIVDNPYLLDIQEELVTLTDEKHNKSKQTTLLFISENISDHALLKYGDEKYFGYTEFDALNYLMAHLNIFNSPPIERVVIRPHPSDKAEKYAAYEAQYPELVTISQSTSLLKDIVLADIITGCEGAALVVALLTQKRVISCIPKGCELRLPHREILCLKDMYVVNAKG